MGNFTNEIWHQRYCRNDDSIIDSENELIDFNNNSFMNSGIGSIGSIMYITCARFFICKQLKFPFKV